MGARGGRLGTSPIEPPGVRPKPARLTPRARKRRGNSTLCPSFQRNPSNAPHRGTRKPQNSAIPPTTPSAPQPTHHAPENPETIADQPEILAPDPHRSSTSHSAEHVSACQNMPRASTGHGERRTCSNREQAQNSKRTNNPLQSIEIVGVFQCSSFSLAHIRVCMCAHIRILPKQRNSENTRDCQAITRA
jgi:hypothetical protein